MSKFTPLGVTLLYNRMEKADFYFEVEEPKGINLIMFRDSYVTFSAKVREKKDAFLKNNPFDA